jgi:hypothetical protein
MIAINVLLSHWRASQLCAHVFMSLFDARVVALSVRLSQSFQRKLSSHALNAIGNAASSCLAPDLQQGLFLFIRFTLLSPRSGIHTLMARTVPERITASNTCATAI